MSDPVHEKMRLFVGVKVSMATLGELAEVRDALAPAADGGGLRVRWVAPASYHVTLKFLGWTRPAVVEALRDRVGEALAGRRAVRFRVGGLSAFPEPERARVVIANIAEGAGALTELAAAVEGAAVDLGFEREHRPFHAHVTLGRLKEVADVSTLLVPFAEQSFSETLVESVTLFESIMKSSGSEYVGQASWALEGGSKGRRRQTEQVEPRSTEAGSDSGED